MGTQGTGRKRSTKKERSTAEDDALNLIAREAEARLAAKRAARAEAREIRMKELERQQKELSDDDERMSVGSRGSVRVEDRDYLEKGSRAASALTAGTLTSLGGTSSRRGSGDTALTVDAETSLREIKEIHELKDQIQDVELKYAQNLKEAKDALAEVEEKYRKAMVSNAQLDNEKNNLMYQVDTLKDSLMELEELLSESQRGHEDKVKELEREKHAHSVLQFQFNEMKETLKQSEELLNKHGVVLGPDLNANGDMSEADVGRSSIADPASQSAADPQTSPSEGNSVLGNTEETHMRSIGEEELDPEPRGEMFEEAKANHLSSDALCDTAGVSTLETPREDQPAEEKECIVTEEDNVEERGLKKDLNVGFNEFSGTEAKDIFTCSSGLQEIAKSSEEDVQETPEGGFSGEKETKSIRVDTHTNNVRESCNISEEQDNKQQDFAENCLESTVSCHQQKVAQDVSEESSLVDSDPAVLNTEPQQEPENAENAENEEEEVSSKSQAHGGAASGKKKRKKRRGRKKGETQKDTNQPKEAGKEKGKTPKNIESTPTDNAPAPEPSIDGLATETLKESMIQAENEQDRQNTEEVDGVEAVKPIETFGHSEESRMEKVTDEPDKEQNLDIVTISETFSPTETLKKVRLDHVVDEQNKETETVEAVEKDEQDKEQNLEIETIQTVEALGTTETSSHIETHEESRTDRVTDEPDQEQILDTVVEAVTMTETFSPTETLKEVRLDHVMDEQNQEAEMIETVEAVETVEEDRTDPQKDKQDEEQNLEIETIQTVEALETTETCSHIETHEEPRTDQVTDEPDQAQILDTVVEAVTMTETFSPTETLKEVRLDHVMDEQNQESEMIETVEAIETVEDRTDPQKDEQDKEQNLEIETIQTVEALETTETFSSTEMLKEMRVDHVMDEQNNEAEMVEAVEAVETVEEDRTGPQMDKQDEEQNLGTEEVEEMESVTSSVAEDNLSAPDLTDNSKVVENTGSECVSGVDNSNSGTGISPSDNSIHTELETVGAAEEATGLTDEMKLECETNDSGSPFERSGEGNPGTEPHVPSNDVIAAESTNHSEDDTLMSLSSTDGFCDGLNSELSSATAAQIKVPEPGPKEETVEAHEEGGAELESERTEEEELNKDLKEAEGLVDPENSDCCNSPTFIKNCELFEKSPETAEQAEQQDDGEGQTSECEDQISKTSDTNEIINVDILNTPDSPEGTTETGHSVQQDHSPEDREHKNHQSDQQSSPELCPVEEQSHELSKDEPGDSDSSQPNLQDCEEDDEDEEGQSFDFDDLDVEAAIATNPPISPKPIEDESNPGSLGLCQSNAGANENAGGEPVRNNDEERVIDEDTQETAGMSLEEASSESVRNVCENPGDTPEEKEVLLADKALVGELGGVAENQAASSPVEEGLIKSEQQTEASVLPQTADHVASDREQPQSRKDAKKKDKKGKAKSKEDCKMS